MERVREIRRARYLSLAELVAAARDVAARHHFK